ncbi:MAG: DNA-directed RNA polymerase subunit beta, partial [Chloroflexi bacterium]|nr:DNA-directed RNA polymerase subunit beta [Chloroflexota bacterium]
MVLAPIEDQSGLVPLSTSDAEIVDYSRLPETYPLPNLIKLLRDSYDWFLEEGLKELLQEMSPIEDFTGNRMQLYFMHDGEDDGTPGYEYLPPEETPLDCRQKDKTYQGELRVKVGLTSKKTGESKQQWLYFGHLPHMTETGTFIINGAERVVVSQLVRSPGVYFGASVDSASGRTLCSAKLIPSRGAWLEFESSNRDVLTVKVDRKRKIHVTTLLRALDDSTDPAFYENGDVEQGKKLEHLLGTDERIRRMLDGIDLDDSQHQFLETTLEKETASVGPDQRNKEWAMIEVYKRLRPGDPPTLDAARAMLEGQFFNPRRYDLGRVGRYKVNNRLRATHAQLDPRCEQLGFDADRGAGDDAREQALWMRDLLAIVFTQVAINNGIQSDDDIDHLGNRRIRAVGEQLQNQFRIGMVRMERVIRERMTIIDPDQAAPSALVNIRPVQAAVKEFFGGHQLSQFMDQTNPLAELTHKRRLSALGPGGLSRDRAGFDVRDVHYSHYGRICPIETPEGPNIGLIGSLATYGVLN